MRWEGFPGSGTLPFYRSGGRSRETANSSARTPVRRPGPVCVHCNLLKSLPKPFLSLRAAGSVQGGHIHHLASHLPSKPRHKGSPNLLSEPALRSPPPPERILPTLPSTPPPQVPSQGTQGINISYVSLSFTSQRHCLTALRIVSCSSAVWDPPFSLAP